MMDMKFILENEIDRHQCPLCLGMWIRFDVEGKLGIYRLSPIEPAGCPTCGPIDQQIESDPSHIVSVERWFE